MTRVLTFDHAKANFMAAARYGLAAQFHWTGGEPISARALILERLLPLARRGLETRGIDGRDVDRYLGVVEARVESGRTGAQWALDSLAAMREAGMTDDARFRVLVSATAERQWDGTPAHEWELADVEAGAQDWRESFRTVRQVMKTDLFTVHPEDLVDLAASVMEWEHIRHVPVEDREGRLVGLVSHRSLLRLVGRGMGGGESVAVREIMKDAVTIGPDASTLEAMERMREHRVGCLPVVEGERLVGIVTEHDFVEVARKLLEEHLQEG